MLVFVDVVEDFHHFIVYAESWEVGYGEPRDCSQREEDRPDWKKHVQEALSPVVFLLNCIRRKELEDQFSVNALSQMLDSFFCINSNAVANNLKQVEFDTWNELRDGRSLVPNALFHEENRFNEYLIQRLQPHVLLVLGVGNFYTICLLVK